MLRAAVVALLLSASAAAQPSAEDYGTEHPGFQAALRYAIPFGQDVIARGDTLVPFGLAITAPAVPNVVQVWDETLNGQQALMLTVETLRSISQTGMVAEGAAPRPAIAVALVLDILTDVPGRPGKTDALAVVLEAPDVTEATSYVLPYVRDGQGGLRYLEPYWRPQPPMLWAR